MSSNDLALEFSPVKVKPFCNQSPGKQAVGREAISPYQDKHTRTHTLDFTLAHTITVTHTQLNPDKERCEHMHYQVHSWALTDWNGRKSHTLHVCAT